MDSGYFCLSKLSLQGGSFSASLSLRGSQPGRLVPFAKISPFCTRCLSKSSTAAVAGDGQRRIEYISQLLPPQTMLAHPGSDKGELPPLAEIRERMVQLLRLPRAQLPPSIFATEVEHRVAELVEQSWGMDPEAFAVYKRIGVWFSSFIFPSAASAERLTAVCIHQSLFALLDDLCFDTGGLDPAPFGVDATIVRNSPHVGDFILNVNSLFRTLELPAQATTVERAIWDAATHLRRVASPQWMDCFADAVEDFIRSCITLQADLEVGGPHCSVRDLQSYTRIRCRNSAVLHVNLLMEVACDAILPTEVRAHPSIQQLTWLCVRIVSFLNDVFSYHKEVAVEGTRFNLIRVLMDVQGVSFAQAVRSAMHMIHSDTQEFAHIEAALPLWESQTVDRTVGRYVRCLKESLVGNFHFHGGINRYRSPDSPFPELRTYI